MNKKLLAAYGLKWNPFAQDLPEEGLWERARTEHFCQRVERLVSSGGFALVTGDPGTGKSVVLRQLAARLAGLRDLTVATLSNLQCSLGDFYRELGHLFGVRLSPMNRWGGFKALRERWQAHLDNTLLRPVLCIDEAQLMRTEVLNELRLLASTHFDSRCVLTVVLAGDQTLVERLGTEALLPLGSRCRVRLHLDHLPKEELEAGLEEVLERAGSPRLLTRELISTLAEHAGGNLRTLMQLGEDVLEAGLEQEVKQLDEALFLELCHRGPLARSAPARTRRRPR